MEQYKIMERNKKMLFSDNNLYYQFRDSVMICYHGTVYRTESFDRATGDMQLVNPKYPESPLRINIFMIDLSHTVPVLRNTLLIHQTDMYINGKYIGSISQWLIDLTKNPIIKSDYFYVTDYGYIPLAKLSEKYGRIESIVVNGVRTMVDGN
jgi:hypothetical protein